MSGTLRRSLLSLFLAYTLILMFCFSASKPTAKASANSIKIRRASKAKLNSPKRIRVDSQNSSRAGRRERELSPHRESLLQEAGKTSRNQNRPIMDPDDGSGRSFEQDKPRIDRFAKEMKVNSSADAYIIAFAGLVSYKNEARIRLNCIRKYLITTHGISRSRLKLIDGGYRVEKSVKLFLVNPGDSQPTPFPTMNRNTVRFTKAPKYPCGKPVRPPAENE